MGDCLKVYVWRSRLHVDIAIILVCICRAAFGQGQSRETINRPIWLYAGNSGNQAWLVFGRAAIRRAPSAFRLAPSAFRLAPSALRLAPSAVRQLLSACGRPRINPEREALPRMLGVRKDNRLLRARKGHDAGDHTMRRKATRSECMLCMSVVRRRTSAYQPGARNLASHAEPAVRLPPCAVRLPPSAFRLPPSAFRLAPSAFRLPQSVSCCQHAAVRVSTRSARPCLACWASGRTTVQCGRAPRRGARNRVDKSSKKTPREEGATNIQIILWQVEEWV